MYIKLFLPIIAGSTLYALNGVIDNFMVGHIEQGVSALGAINAWTSILIGWFIATAAAGSVTMSQFYYDKKFDVVKQISRYRFLLGFSASIPLFIIAQVNPDILTKVFLRKGADEHAYQLTLLHAREYAKVISLQWLVFSFAFNLGNQLREMKHAKIVMLWGIGTLSTNMTLNATLMYGLHMGVSGAAWASFAARLVAITVGVTYILVKKVPIDLNAFHIFKISRQIRKIYWKRWIYFASIFTVIFFINLRTSLYAAGYPGTNQLGTGVNGLSVVGLTGALMNVFTTTFASLASMASIFVASELGKGNLKKAKINSDELKGFNTLMSIILSIIAVTFASLLPFMKFLSKDQFDAAGIKTFDSAAQLRQVQFSIYVMAFYYPIWIWFSTSYRNGNAGGKGGWFAFTDWIITLAQLVWLAIVMLVIVPNAPIFQQWFALSYFVFFLSDFAKLIVQESIYYKSNKWLHSITRNEYHKEEISARDQSFSRKI